MVNTIVMNLHHKVHIQPVQIKINASLHILIHFGELKFNSQDANTIVINTTDIAAV